METRNVTITLEKAKEWFNSGNSSLKEVALQAFSEEELKPSFKDIKTFEDACEVLGINPSDIGCLRADPKKGYYIYSKTKASFATLKINIIRQALNKGFKMSFTKGDVYYPQIRFVTQKSTFYNGELKSGYMRRVANFEVDGEEYSLLGGHAYSGSDAGLGCFHSSNGVGYSYADVGFLCCATREIAEHMSNYFAKEIFEAMYGDLIDYKWL